MTILVPGAVPRRGVVNFLVSPVPCGCVFSTLRLELGFPSLDWLQGFQCAIETTLPVRRVDTKWH